MSIFMPFIPNTISESRFSELKKKESNYGFLYRRAPFDVINDNLLVMAVDAMEAYADAMQLNKLHLIYMSDKKRLIQIVNETKTYSEFLSSVLSYCTAVSKERFIHPFDIRIPEDILVNHTPVNDHNLSDSTKEYFLRKSRNV